MPETPVTTLPYTARSHGAGGWPAQRQGHRAVARHADARARRRECRIWSCASAISARFAGGLADQVFEDGAILKLGAALIVYAGLVNSPTEIFRGKITALEAYLPEQRAARS